ncbi:MAG: amidase [Acidobacteria bacterium]|nr:amidase [Acidobacteriota bacterium]
MDCFMTAVDMARLIREGGLSARELVTAHLDRIERLNPRVNAIVTLTAEQAMREAAAADEDQVHGRLRGPLHGLPVAHKDLAETAGVRTTFGSPLFRDNIPVQDEIVVERLKRAGAITLGKTNTPEFGAGSQTFNPVFGATLNPYDVSRTCGGSSGGAAVALACGFTPIADGSDMGGSLRNPAAFCNVVGLRTAPGRVPNRAFGLAWSPLAVTGPMARTVADVAMMLSAIAGPDARSPISLDHPGEVFAEPLGRDLKGVRIAWFRDLGGVPFDRRIRAVVDAQRRVFEDLGCIVEVAEPGFEGVNETFLTLRAWTFEAAFGDLPPAAKAQLKDTIRHEIDRGASLAARDISRAEFAHTAFWQRFQQLLERYEYFILPVTQVPPFDVQQPYISEIDGVPMTSYTDWMRSCYYISVAGNPAISVPCGFTAEGLPVGLQIVGRWRDEWSVLQLAHAYESAAGYWRRRPEL